MSNAVLNDRMDVREWLRKQIETAQQDLPVGDGEDLRRDADETCRAPYGVVSPDRVN